MPWESRSGRARRRINLSKRAKIGSGFLAGGDRHRTWSRDATQQLRRQTCQRPSVKAPDGGEGGGLWSLDARSLLSGEGLECRASQETHDKAFSQSKGGPRANVHTQQGEAEHRDSREEDWRMEDWRDWADCKRLLVDLDRFENILVRSFRGFLLLFPFNFLDLSELERGPSGFQWHLVPCKLPDCG